MTQALGFDFTKCYYHVDPETFRITTYVKRAVNQTDETIKSLFALAPHLNTNASNLSIPHLEALRDLSLYLAKYAEAKHDNASRLKAISTQFATLALTREEELCTRLRLTLSLTESFLYDRQSKLRTIISCIQMCAARHLSQEPFLSGYRYAQEAIVHVLATADKTEYRTWLQNARVIDPELTFLKKLVARDLPLAISHTILGCFQEACHCPDWDTAKTHMCVKLFLFCQRQIVFHDESLTHLLTLRMAVKLYLLDDILTLTSEPRKSLELALTYFREAISLANKTQNEDFLHKLINKLIELDDTYNWLHQLLEINDKDLEPIVELLIPHANSSVRTLTPKVLQRVMQLASIPEDQSSLSLVMLFRLAYFIETELSDSSCIASTYIKKNISRNGHSLQSFINDPINPRTRSIIRCAENGDFLILCKRNVPCTKKDLPYKRFSVAIWLPYNAQIAAEPAFQWVTPFVENFQKEAALYKSLNGSPGIWPLITVCHYRHSSSSAKGSVSPVEKLSVAIKKDEGTFEEVMMGTLSLTPKQVVAIFHQLAQGLEYMHDTKGLVHAAINPQAIYIGYTNDGKCIGGLHTFERCFNVDREAQGAIIVKSAYTAPELLSSKKPFTGNYFKTDVFSLGCIFYQWLTNKCPSWFYSLDDSEAYTQTINQEVEPQLKVLQTKHTLDNQEQFLWILLNMLVVDPEKRFSMPRVRQELDKHRTI